MGLTFFKRQGNVCGAQMNVLFVLRWSALFIIALVFLDMVTTWWFMSPLKALGVDPKSQEQGITTRYLVTKLGIRAGLVTNGIIEALVINTLVSFAIVIFRLVFGGLTLIFPVLFIDSLLASRFILIAKRNYRAGKENRRIALSLGEEK